MSDPNAKVKNRQMWILGGAALGILGLTGAGVYLFDGPAPVAKEKPKVVSLTPPGTVEDKDAWRADVAARGTASERALVDTANTVKRQDETIKRLAGEIEALKKGAPSPSAAASSSPAGRTVAADDSARRVLDTPLPAGGQRVLTSPAGATAVGYPPRPGPPPAPGAVLNQPLNGNAPTQPAREAIEMVTFGSAAAGQGTSLSSSSASGPDAAGPSPDDRARRVAEPRSPDADKKTAMEFLPAGSFVRVAMLNGVDAPTGGQAQSNPLPMAFQVLDTANLANRYKLDIRDCRIIAAAWGDLSSERTMGRTETLSCIIDGDTVEMPVRGTVIGEDGKAGIRGRLVTKQGQLLANALFAGSLAGIGRAFQASATITTAGAGGVTQTVDPEKVAQAGIGGGVGQAASMLATYYLKAADKLFPVIETDGGRVVEILVTKGAVYQGKASKRDTYRGLLRRAGDQARSNDDD